MFDEIVVPESDYYSSGIILYNLCGYDEPSEMFSLKSGIFPNLEGRKRENLLKIAFCMMATNPKLRTTPQ